MDTKLLAGPILRRTTKNRVCVWLASSEPMSIQLTIMDVDKNQLGQSRLANLNEQYVQLGNNLYIFLLQALANDKSGFPSDTLLYYRIDMVDAVDSSRSPLFSDDELKKLVYGAHPYPSFFIPAKLEHLLHGSCRKPHGGFDSENQAHLPDALSHGHTLLEGTCDDLSLRPAILLLTGDQIYADDVAISLMATLQEKSLILTGRQEMLPLSDDGSMRLNPLSIPLHGRKLTLDDKNNVSGKNSGFSSDESENHLFTFGEFAAMYIYAFGNFPAWEPVWDWQQLADMNVSEGADKAWKNQLRPLSFFDNTLSDIRRLMANIPTYMSFDDHDVTDDWNITRDWYDGVRESPLGRRIVANALAACWAFQAWGNNPDNFDNDLLRSITQHLNDSENDANTAERYELHTWKSRGWGFSIPTEPPIIAIDSRTQRQYENRYYPAQLLDRYAQDWLRIEWAKLKTRQKFNNDTCPVLIAATPVMGYSVVENIQLFFLWLAEAVENYSWVQFVEKIFDIEGILTGWMVKKLDAESWSSNREGFIAFMTTLSMRMGIRRCVFLSGDVHYSFTANAYFKQQGRELQCYQLTSSALSNQPDAKQSKFLEETAKQQTGKDTHRNWSIFPSKRWVNEVELLEMKGSDSRVNAKCNLGLVAFLNGLPVRHTLLTGSGNLICQLTSAAKTNGTTH